MRLITFLVLTALLMTTVWGGDIVFIANKDIKINKVSKKLLARIYLGKVNVIDGVEVIPVNLPPNNPLRKEVEKELLGMDREELQLYWNRMYLEGIEPPIVLPSQKAVVEFVKKVKGAIGYVEEKYVDKDVKVIFRLKWASDSR